jgi:hypothetical protein
MKKLLLILLFLPLFGFSQCEYPESEVTLKSLEGLETHMSLCYRDSMDILVVRQPLMPKVTMVPNASMGEYFLKKDYCILFISEKREFKSKLLKENEFYNDSSDEGIDVFKYYVVNKNKLRLILKQSVDIIYIVKDNEIDTYELSHDDAINLYHIVYNYFRLRGWK